MSRVVLITAQPRAPSTGVATTLRMAGGGNAKPYYYASQHYRAGIIALSRFTAAIEFDESGWTGAVTPTTGQIVWAPSSKTDLAAMAAYYWPGAAVTVAEGDEDIGTFTTRLTGKVADTQVQDHQLVITVADLAVGLDQPVVTARFAGTGGAEGGTEAKNRIKRRSWGRCFNLEGRILDKANNVYEFGDLSFPWQQFDVLRDIGRDAAPAPTVVTWQGSIASTLTALAASTPVAGSGVVAPSIACAKWWTQPVGPLTADIRGEVGAGYVETCPEIAAAILAALSGPTVTNTAAMAALRAGVAGIHIEDGENINSALTRLLLGISVFWKLNADLGTITLYEFTFASPVASLISDNADRLRTMKPIKTRRLGYQRAYRTHSDGEIAASLLAMDPTSPNKTVQKYKRQFATPATPTGDNPSGWSDTIPAGTETLWVVIGTMTLLNTLVGTWSTPQSDSGMTPRDPYDNAVTYYKNNLVPYLGGSYFALQNNFSGQAPSGTAQATAYWGVLAAPGDEGVPATPPGAFSATISLASGAAINLRTVANANGYTGLSDATITFNVPNGVTIRGLSGSGIGLDSGTWPTGYTIALTLVVQSGGIVDGGGGEGGSADAGAGGAGGDAIYLRVNMTGGVTINSGGIVRGGGGGGGAGANFTEFYYPFTVWPASGGGGGAPNGAGGAGEANGSSGTTGGGGAGGAGVGTYGEAGAAGGNFAVAGTSAGGFGGAAGYAVRKNGKTATVTNNGTMTGTAG